MRERFCPALRTATGERTATRGAELPARCAFGPALGATHAPYPERKRRTHPLVSSNLAQRPAGCGKTARMLSGVCAPRDFLRRVSLAVERVEAVLEHQPAMRQRIF